jgi:1,2-diacylglycerol 3-beta-galactosyltransferase
VLILMSDTGGGHRAAAEAIRDALKQRYGDLVSVDLVDVFRSYTPFPFKYAPELYPMWIKRGKLIWLASYKLTDRRSQVRLVMGSMGGTVRRGLRRMLVHEPDVDVIVCVHPLFSSPAMTVLQKQPDRVPFITVVTDLVSTHAFWYDRRVDRLLVPTQPAYDRGIKLGIRPDQIRVTGLPVHPRFAAGLIDKTDARKKLGWDSELPAILLIGGGEGMGPLWRIARRINKLDAKFQLVIVAGRNEKLRARLQAQKWNHPTHIYPFVTNMPELMVAADLLVTKAGPATISEACIAGLPMILSDAIPGQEGGNVKYITEHQAGIWAPGPARVAKALREWLAQGPEFLRERAENARQLGQPDAVWKIADEIWHYAQQPRIPQATNPRRRSLLSRRQSAKGPKPAKPPKAAKSPKSPKPPRTTRRRFGKFWM